MLRELPFRTFGEIAVLGLEVEVHCLGCYREVNLDPADEQLHAPRTAASSATRRRARPALSAVEWASDLTGMGDSTGRRYRCPKRNERPKRTG